MKFNEYQNKAIKFDLERPGRNITGGGFIEKVLGLVGEAGETADKFKKIIRDEGGTISEKSRGEIVKELGDVLWYIASIARYLDTDLSKIAHDNIAKLEDRYQRNLLHGEGDER